MALNHLGIGGRILNLAFGIMFGGIVLALSLAVGLGAAFAPPGVVHSIRNPGPHRLVLMAVLAPPQRK